MEEDKHVDPPVEDSESDTDFKPDSSEDEAEEEEVVPAPKLKTKSTAVSEEEKEVRKQKVSQAVLDHCARMRELRKSKPPQVSKVKMKAKAKETQPEVVKHEAEKIDKLYEEVVEKKQKPQSKPISVPRPAVPHIPAPTPPSLRDIIEVKNFYKSCTNLSISQNNTPPRSMTHLMIGVNCFVKQWILSLFSNRKIKMDKNEIVRLRKQQHYWENRERYLDL
jgi:hypothetical protein